MIFSTLSPHKLLLNRVSEEAIMEFYCGKLFKRVSSPLHKDENPSFSTFYNENNQLRFRDFALGISGDVFSLVKEKYSCSFREALHFIDRDLNLNILAHNREYNDSAVKLLERQIKIPIYKPKYQIRIQRRELDDNDINYWNEFGISKETLKIFNVIPINNWWLGEYTMYKQKIEQPAYAYKLGSRHKIYCPLATDRINKFKGNSNSNTIQGWEQLKRSHKYLVITSSLKEVMLLHELGIQAIAPNSESTIINEKFIELFKKYFNLIIFYDFDDKGQEFSQRHSELYDCKWVKYSNKETKDLTDFYKENGKIETNKLVNKLLKTKFTT